MFIRGVWNSTMDDAILQDAEIKLGHSFTDKTLLKRALRHASQAETRLKSNERLEFLGDSVLGMVVCEHLYQRYPDYLEGELTKIKSNVVSRRTCADVANQIGLSELLQLGKGMGGREELPQSLAAAVFESLIGAMYLDAGLETARQFILRHLGDLVSEAARLGHQHNFKSVLQQALQRLGGQNPVYPVLEECGPDHAKRFHVSVQIESRRYASCWGGSKKQAEQEAALATLVELGLAETDDDGDIRLLEVEDIDLDAFGHCLLGSGAPSDEPLPAEPAVTNDAVAGEDAG
jgi:ribonuclease-3